MTVSVKVKCFNGQSYDLSVEEGSGSVAELQEQISEASGIVPDRQTILFKGQVLETGKPLSDYSLSNGVTLSVVRRVGKAAPAAGASIRSPPPPKTTSETSNASASTSVTRKEESATKTIEPPTAQPSIEDMMGMLGLGGGGSQTLGGMNPRGSGGGMPDFGALSEMLNGGGVGGSGGGAPNMDQWMSQLPNMMNSLMNTPLLQEYLQDPEKQEASREAIINNPMLKGLLEKDPEFAKVVNDPEKWQASMEAAKMIFNNPGAKGSTTGSSAAPETDPGSTQDASRAPRSTGGAKRPSAADKAPPGIDIARLSECYGHALGQSLINSGLGLEPELVVKGFQSAVEGKGFPMALPEYERSMAQLQTIAAEFLKKANLEDANNLLEELTEDGQAVVIEEGRIVYEKGDIEPDTSKPVAKADATVLVIVSARLLDGRHFFTCPAADDTGESVHPLTLPLATAPPALAKGIVGMHETESRLLYVHPFAAEGMAEMFGDLLPPNALLIFDLQLVSANAPEEDLLASQGDAAASLQS